MGNLLRRLVVILAGDRIGHPVVAVFDVPMAEQAGGQFRCPDVFKTAHVIADFPPVMTVVHGLGETSALRIKISGIKLVQREGEWIADFIVQTALVAFDSEDAVTAFSYDFAGDGALGSHGVDGGGCCRS